MADVLIPLLGPVILTCVAWAWAGRSRRARAWAGEPIAPLLVLGVFPAMGLMLSSFGLNKLFGDVVSPLTSLLFLVSILTLLFGFITPRFWGPRWYHRMSDKDKLDTSDSLNATAIAVMAGRGPGPSAIKASEVFGGRGKPLSRWRGGYVYDPDVRERAHGMARRGTVDGTLTLYAEGVTFAASNWEDELREEETVLVLPREKVCGVRVVPPRAGADGVQRRGFWFRSWFSRLVVETGDDSYLFEVSWGRARQVAERVNAMTGQVS